MLARMKTPTVPQAAVGWPGVPSLEEDDSEVEAQMWKDMLAGRK